MKTQLVRRWTLVLLLALLAVGTLACSEQVPAGPRVWIDWPRDGSRVSAGTPIAVVSHAYAPDGVAELLLTVNGEAYRRSPPAQPDSTFSKASLDWIAPKEGLYTIELVAYSRNGQASNPASVRVKATGPGTPTPTATPTRPTVVPLPDFQIVNVEAVVAGVKGDTPFCNTRVTYRNAGEAAVPLGFTIQFHFNGTPQIANTVAGGLPAGATAEITFVYQFEGSPYIGINLDSTNVINESNETNNAFAEARTCGATPSPVTRIPTPTATPTLVTPPPPSTGCSGTPNIAFFSANPATIQRGDSTTLSWGAVTNSDSVSIEPGIGGVPAPGSRSVSPNSTTTYTLLARCGGQSATRQTTVNVSAPPSPTPTPTRTRTPTPRDTQGPPAPNLVSPRGNQSQCKSSVTLDWNPVSDPSGIKNYIVKWVRDGGQSGGTVTSGTSHNISIACDNKSHTYSWSVQAVDNANNAGGTGSASFTVPAGLH